MASPMMVLGVKEIQPLSLLAKHNEEKPEECVEVNDVLISVNGVRGDWKLMLAELAKPSVSIVVERPAPVLARSSRLFEHGRIPIFERTHARAPAPRAPGSDGGAAIGEMAAPVILRTVNSESTIHSSPVRQVLLHYKF